MLLSYHLYHLLQHHLIHLFPSHDNGTMIEIPRATIVANEIAEVAEFFSFGTNDLTQMTLGFSRDDVNAIIHNYVDNKMQTSNT